MVTHKIKTTISAITCRDCGLYSYYVHDLDAWQHLSKDKQIGTCQRCSYERWWKIVRNMLSDKGL